MVLYVGVDIEVLLDLDIEWAGFGTNAAGPQNFAPDDQEHMADAEEWLDEDLFLPIEEEDSQIDSVETYAQDEKYIPKITRFAGMYIVLWPEFRMFPSFDKTPGTYPTHIALRIGVTAFPVGLNNLSQMSHTCVRLSKRSNVRASNWSRLRRIPSCARCGPWCLCKKRHIFGCLCLCPAWAMILVTLCPLTRWPIILAWYVLSPMRCLDG